MRAKLAKSIKKQIAQQFTGDKKDIYANPKFKSIYRRSKKNYIESAK